MRLSYCPHKDLEAGSLQTDQMYRIVC